ncbi:flagellar motor switch protein FliN [Providencia sneebia DSM 19967]|uniref:Flagellar motor switch protein FliN n=2 Tax=Providencia sneebia TaxID=516075 RepID=K8WF66_9GAMM|nr:flagellar motor switch protein FliN [Providencia sneebia DSM 19967]
MNETTFSSNTLIHHENEVIPEVNKMEFNTDNTSICTNINEQVPIDQLSNIDLIMDIPVNLSVELGKTKMTISKLSSLSQGSVIPLDGQAGELLNIFINGYLIAQGEIVVVSNNYGIRITDIINSSERMHRLSR